MASRAFSVATSNITSQLVLGANLNFDAAQSTKISDPGANTLAIFTSSQERLRVDANGNVGISTGSPSHRTAIHQSSGSAAPDLRSSIQLYLKGYGGGNQYHSGIGFAMNEHTSGYWGSAVIATDDTGSYGSGLAFYTSSGSATPTPTEKMRISSNGNVGIGTTSPTYKLHVNGTQYWGGNITWAGGVNILVNGESSFDVNSGGTWSVYDAATGGLFVYAAYNGNFVINKNATINRWRGDLDRAWD